MSRYKVARRARTCKRPDCHNLFAVLTNRHYCSDWCKRRTQLDQVARRNFRIIPCLHPECANLFRPRTAQRYCSLECRIEDRKCSTCGDDIPLNAPGTKNRYCRLCDRVKKYGITGADYKTLLAKQDHRCRICGTEHYDGVRDGMDSPLVVDHCHDTGAVRGLLCPKCNMAIGLLGDDPATVQAATDYLRSHKGVQA